MRREYTEDEYTEDVYIEDDYITDEEYTGDDYYEEDNLMPEEEISYDFSEDEYFSDEIEYEDEEIYNADYRGDEYYEDDFYEGSYDGSDYEAVNGGGSGGLMDKIIAVTGVVVLALVLVVLGFFLLNRNSKNEVSELANVGAQIESIHMIGEQGIENITQALLNRIKAEADFDYDDDDFGGYEENEYDRDITVVLNMTSIQKDLKIKFISKKSGKLVPYVPFTVSVKGPDGNTSIWSDDDMDGIIYKKNITPGNYEIEMEELTDSQYDKYTLTSGRQSVVVKKEISYQKVDVENEVKKESEVDSKKEDTAKKETVVESTLSDTVAWVDSKVITSTYVEVPKSTITDPMTLQVVRKAFLRMAAVIGCTITGDDSVVVNKQIKLTATASYTNDDKYRVDSWTYEWKSLDPTDPTDSGKAEVVGHADGSCTVTGKAPGTVRIQCTATGEKKAIGTTGGEPGSSDSGNSSSGTDSGSPSGGTDSGSSSGGTDSGDASGSAGSGDSSTGTDSSDSASAGGSTEGSGSGSVEEGTSQTPPDNEGGSTGSSEPADSTSDAAPNALEAVVIIKEYEIKVVDVFTGAVTLEPETVSVSAGGTTTVQAKPTGFEAGKTLKYNVTSADETIAKATVDVSGKITIEGVATAADKKTKLTLAVNYAEGGTSDTVASKEFEVSVIKGKKITFEKETATIIKGEKLALTAFIDGNSTQTPKFEVVSSDPSIAIGKAGTMVVENGVAKVPVTFEALAIGSVRLTLNMTQDNLVTRGICDITVKASPKEDTKTALKDNQGQELYVLENGKYRKAAYADYYKADKFFIKGDVKYTGWQTIGGKVYFFKADGTKVTGEQVIQGAKYNFGSDGALQVGSGLLGIDVSKWNGTIDWKAVKNSGINYVIIRCGYRGSSKGTLIEDPKFTANIKGATEAGLKVGVYFFTQAIDEIEAVEEASMVIGQIKNYKLSYPVFLDVEPSGGRADSLDAETRTKVCKAFCQTIQNAGYTAGIYANKSWLETKLKADQLSAYKIWLAQYASAPTYAGRYDMWQYRSTGKVSGISGDVDLNLSYMGY